MTDRYENIRDALAGVAERESLRQRAAAWDAVADTLGEVCPEWINHPGTGTEAAVAAIRKLAQQPSPGTSDSAEWVVHPAEAQGGGEDPEPDDGKVICPACCHQFRAIPVQVQRDMIAAGFDPPFTAPPSAPVGVEEMAGLLERIRDLLASLPMDCLGTGIGASGQPYPIRDEVIHSITKALAQQPEAGEEIMVNAAHDVYTLPLQPSGLSSGPRFVVHVPGPEKPAADSRSTHRVWWANDWLPCYCAATSDHRIGNEQPAGVDEAAREDADRWRALRELDGGEIYALLGDCDGIHPEQADAAIDRARGKEVLREAE